VLLPVNADIPSCCPVVAGIGRKLIRSIVIDIGIDIGGDIDNVPFQTLDETQRDGSKRLPSI
jgi:hypothetical protein